MEISAAIASEFRYICIDNISIIRFYCWLQNINIRMNKKEEKQQHKEVVAPSKNYRVHVLVTLVSVVCFVLIKFKLANVSVTETEIKDGLFTPEILAQYNGEDGSKGLYLSIMGEVFDVEKGRKHYGVGGSYSAFAGRDASKLFITGEFNKVDEESDNILTMSSSEILSLSKWKKFYETDYVSKGKLIGRFYDRNGEKTAYYRVVDQRIEEALAENEKYAKFQADFPSCNIEWNADLGGTKVWCTSMSGGTERGWVGFPRQYYNEQMKQLTCVCVKEENLELKQFKPYDNCDEHSDTCVYKDDIKA